jgi:hypothetical protein
VNGPARRRGVGGLLAGLLAVAAAFLPATPASATATQSGSVATATSPTVTVAVTSIDPLVLRQGDDLTLRVRLTNGGGAPVAQPRVLLHLRSRGFISRSSLDLWREAGPYDDLGTTVLTQDLDAPLGPGRSTTVTLTVPGTSLGLPRTYFDWGARGVGVELVDAADPTRLRLGVARTFVVWYPRSEVNPTVVSMLVPVTGPPPTPDATDRVAELTSVGGRLRNLLRATAQHPEVSWAIDPWLVQTAQEGAPEPIDITTVTPTLNTPSPGSDESGADPSGTQSPGSTDGTDGSGSDHSSGGADPAWGGALVSGAAGREVDLLPWGDADVAALVHDGDTALLDDADARSAATAATLGLPGTDSLLLPGDALPDLATAARAAQAGQSLVVGPGELPHPAVLTYTPSGVASVATSQGDATVLVPDERLSSALTTGWVLGPDATTAPLTGATAAADLLAELAVITRERPADSRHMLLVTPRDWDPQVDVVRAQLDALEAAPWVRTAPLAELATVTPTAERGTLPDRSLDATEVTAAQLQRMAETLDRRRSLATIVPKPDALLGDLDAERLAPAALAWRDDPAGRTALVGASVARTETLAGAVTVPESADLNLIASSGELPLRVANALDQPVTVDVRLRPSDSRLVARQTVEVQIPAGGEETVQIPVHGVQTADVAATVELLTPDGVLLDDSTTVVVKVRAEWESIGTAIIGGLLALAFVLGLFRTIRRGRGRRRGDPAPAVDETPATAPPAPEAAGTWTVDEQTVLDPDRQTDPVTTHDEDTR